MLCYLVIELKLKMFSRIGMLDCRTSSSDGITVECNSSFLCLTPPIFLKIYPDILNNPSTATTQKWVHRKCSGIKGSMYKVMKSFVCRGCVNPVSGTGCKSIDIGDKLTMKIWS